MMLDTGCWMLDAGCWMLGAGCWMLDAGCWMLDAGCWVLDAGCWMMDDEYLKLKTQNSKRAKPIDAKQMPRAAQMTKKSITELFR